MDEQEIYLCFHSLVEDFGSEVGMGGLRQFLIKPQPQIQPTMTSTGQMMTNQPLIMIIWIYQEMMVWMSRKSICSLQSLMEDFGSEVAMGSL
jgi:hypothetical protein